MDWITLQPLKLTSRMQDEEDAQANDTDDKQIQLSCAFIV